MMDLNEHYARVAENFLQTAIVIDDQAQFGPVTMVGPVTSVVPPPAGLLDAAGADSNAADTGVTVAVETPPEPPAVSLDAKTLSEAFLAKKMICGLYRPSAGEDMVAKTIGVAQAADVVVVDWHLVQGSSRQAKDIVLGLLKTDREEKGRLRLIAIYTSQPGREAIASELLTEINESEELNGALNQDGPVLRSADTRIVVLNKTRTPDAADREEVPEEALPARLIAEFAHLSRGVLASFALSSVAAVRRGAHHVLALYTSEVDGAFIAHRCEIPNPDDAKAFVLDMITSELRNLIEVDDVAEQTLGAEVISAWIDEKIAAGHQFKNDHAQIPADELRKFIAGGAEALKQSKVAQHVPGDPAKKPDQWIKAGTLARAFYETADDAKRAVRRLSRLSTFQRENTRTRLPPEWRPKLTLGTVIKRIDGGDQLLMCVQPRCDSIRLSGSTAFPFQTIRLGGTTFNLVVPDVDGQEIEVWVNMKPRDTHMIEFEPDADLRAVLAVRHAETGRFLFKDKSGQSYAWIGDIKAMKAQRWVVELGSRVQAVGMEEFEWLRLASEEKVKLNWAG
jgi:hypothetical protein